MRQITAFLVAMFALLPCASQASGFEFCDFTGGITAVAVAPAKRTYDLRVLVVAASRSKRNGKYSGTDCAEYIGQPMDLSLRLPRRAGDPGIGDQIRFYRSAVDGFGADGSYVGTSIQVRFIELLKGPRQEG